ncbi:MAG: ATP-grasp domain-containing protein [bacterium]|nr:ATP-grasp domain-containing protein [bacterium]
MKMQFRKVLVANRGEVACRVIATLRRMGIVPVAIYSDADVEARHVKQAEEAYHVGGSPVGESYLNREAIISVGRSAGVDALHPGYGLLSEQPDFAAACEGAGIAFIGPSSRAMRAMASKLQARRLMQEAGVPIVPGATTACIDVAEGESLAAELGYPVLVKASGGGGGIGMQIVRQPGELAAALESCRRLAERYFGDATVYIEKYIERPRHIEIQVLGDRFGRVVAVHERECSIQRRHQKVIEEAPSPAVGAALRARMAESAVRGAAAIGYTNAGTLEFVLDERGNYYFMEMNTRLQVEHPVTESITGLDLVAAQVRLAEGEPLAFDGAPPIRGHAIECRIYAEDPKRLLPSPGKILRLRLPRGEGIRVDHGVDEGYVVTPHYDPLLAKLIVWAEMRPDAIARAIAALQQTEIDGIKTNIPVLVAILRHPDFAAGNYDTEFIGSQNILASI